MHVTVVQFVTFIVAFALAASRILNATKPFWALFPAWLARVMPALVVAVPALGQLVVGAQTWADLAVAFLTAGALFMPGAASHLSAEIPPTPPYKPSNSRPFPGSDTDPTQGPPRAAMTRFDRQGNLWAGAAVALVALLALQSCSLFGSNSPVVPTVEKCAPATQSVVNEVAQILLAGGDYEKALEDLAKKYTENMVVCVVNSLVKQWGEPTAKRDQAHVAARARGQAYLAEKAPQ